MHLALIFPSYGKYNTGECSNVGFFPSEFQVKRIFLSVPEVNVVFVALACAEV